jgi:glycosyltransferase 2 family protein
LKKSFKNILNFIVFPFIGILLLYFAFKDIDLQKLWCDIKNANFYWVGLSLIFGFLAFISRALRWKLLIEPLGYKPSSRNATLAVITAYFANIAIPRLGEITRCGSLNKTDNIPMDKLIGTVITERVIDFITLLLLIAFVVIMKFDQVGGFFMDQIVNPLYDKYFSTYTFWIVAISGFVFLIVLFLYGRKKLIKNAIFQRVNNFIKGLIVGLKSVFRMKKFGFFLIHTVFIWTMYALMTYVVFFAIEPTHNLTFIDSIFILSIGSLGMSAPVQNGFGAYHWIVSLGLMLYGISQADGLLYATICHESQMIMVLILGPIAMTMIFLTKKKQQIKN